MKFTLSWLKEHLETSAPLSQIAETLTAIGLEVEDIFDPAAKLKDFIVAEIVEAAPHPNANKLQVCKVNDGTRLRQVVCGAANARAGLKVVLVREGVYIPGGGITIKKTKIRDVESDGMLCSAEELQLASSSEGIIELPATAKPGTAAADALGANDPVLHINLTPNRADCLGVRGIARDLAAADIGRLKALGFGIKEEPLKPQALSPKPLSVTITTPDCSLFIGCLIRGVKNGPSPAWLQARLSAIGLRPISSLVDITNYFAFTFARPLHVFDAAKLSGNIVVRAAKAGEKLHGLNGKEYALDASMTVIADDSGARSLAGIIGGEDSGCTEATTDVFLEAAVFDPANIAATGRKLDVISDARYRFERGVDAAFTEAGAKLAAQMITELCGGEASALVVAGKAPAPRAPIAFDYKSVETLGGAAVAEAECTRILKALGFAVEKNRVSPPSWRNDVEGSADLVEEILRIHGYHNIPPLGIQNGAAFVAAPPRERTVRRLLAARGMMEVCSFSFLPAAQARAFGAANPILLQNPISAELDAMRPSLLPNLLTAAKNNMARSIHDLHLFEAGATFHGVKPEDQRTAAAGIRIGQRTCAEYISGYRQLARDSDAMDAKSDAMSLLDSLGVKESSLAISTDTPPWYHPGRSGALVRGKDTLGYFGEIHPGVAMQFGIEGRVAAFEVVLSHIPPAKAKGTAKPAFNASPFQPVERDFAFVVKQEVSAAQIRKALAQAEKNLVKEVRIFDVYSGKGLEAGSKSVAVKVVLQANRTLTDAEITAVSNAIVAAAKTFGGSLRQ